MRATVANHYPTHPFRTVSPRTPVNKDKREGPELLRPGPIVALISRCAPASARREPGHRLRHTLPRPYRLQRTLRSYRPAVDATAVGVDRVEESPVAGEGLVAEPRHALDRDARRRIFQRQRTVGCDREARDGSVGVVRREGEPVVGRDDRPADLAAPVADRGSARYERTFDDRVR